MASKDGQEPSTAVFSQVRGPDEPAMGDVETVDDLLLDEESVEQPLISFVLPTLDEEDGIGNCLEQIRSVVAELDAPAEILVSDSSTDRTPEIARSYGAVVLEPERKGYGNAYKYAFERARGEYVVMGDADTTYDFEEVPRLVERLLVTDADIVMGSRLAGDIKPGAMPPLHQYVGNPLLTKFLNVFYDAGVSDAHSGMRVFTSEALEALDLQSSGMEFASEMIMQAAVLDLTIEEVPITYHEREGEATLHSFRDGWRHVKFMLVNAPSYLFSVPGAAFALFGALLMTTAYFDLGYGGIDPGVHSMVAGSLLVILGYQVLTFGALTTVAGNPIRTVGEPFTARILEHLSLERGATIGVFTFGVGAAYATYLLTQWVQSGFETLPVLMADMVAFTAIVLGIQTVFGAFCLSALRD